MNNLSTIATSLTQDSPLEMDSEYVFDDDDRRFIDNQIQGVEQLIVQCLIKGTHCTFARIANSSPTLNTGDVVCLASVNGTEPLVTKALPSPLADAQGAYGIVLLGAAAGGYTLIAIGGAVPPSTTGLAPGSPGKVRVDTITGGCERVATLNSSDYGLGWVDNAGWMTVTFPSAGSGGGSSFPGAANDIPIGDGSGGAVADTGNFCYDPTLHSFCAGSGNTAPSTDWTCTIGVNNTASGAGSAAFGDTTTASGVCSFSTGSNSVSSGDDSFTMGSGCTAAGLRSFAGGENCTTGGAGLYDQFSFGANCQANNYYAVALGYHTTAGGEGSIATGLVAATTMFGERAHNSLVDGTGDVQDYHEVSLFVDASSAPANAVTQAGELVLPLDATNYDMQVRIMATLDGTTTVAKELHEILLQTHGGAVVLPAVEDDIITNRSVGLAANGWSVTMANPSGLTLRFVCDPAGNAVSFFIAVKWRSMPGV